MLCQCVGRSLVYLDLQVQVFRKWFPVFCEENIMILFGVWTSLPGTGLHHKSASLTSARPGPKIASSCDRQLSFQFIPHGWAYVKYRSFGEIIHRHARDAPYLVPKSAAAIRRFGPAPFQGLDITTTYSWQASTLTYAVLCNSSWLRLGSDQ